ncbi:hypothetical protein Poly59_35690 [Rubripirellula reticaptiva]|uniref:Uncharacterized protein n=1 Tax=Rubripirellula reticaptiva TaxID=2528013 RepID=A0A5C6ESI0_9BACT|nr:hypothetical protein Poly59_35690 [Rubripirellula reticaptiva]
MQICLELAWISSFISMNVVRRIRDDIVDVRIQMIAEHSFAIHTGQSVPEMSNHGVGVEQLPVGIPIKSPRIGSAAEKHFKRFVSG